MSEVKPNGSNLIETPRSVNTKNAYLPHLQKVDWAIFGVVEWHEQDHLGYTEAAEQLRATDFHWLLGATCGRLKLRTRNLAVYRKTEWDNTGSATTIFWSPNTALKRSARG